MKCPNCPKKCKTERALKIHRGIKHFDKIVASTIDIKEKSMYLDSY